MAEYDIYSIWIPITISSAAFALSLITLLLKRRSDEFQIALNFNSKIKEQSDEIVEAISRNEPPENIRYKELEYLNTWEFFAFLVNNYEITNKNILNYFKPSFISSTKNTLEGHPDVAKDNKKYEEITTRLKKWGQEIEVKDSSKTSTA
jgi:hypothetical protein